MGKKTAKQTPSTIYISNFFCVPSFEQIQLCLAVGTTSEIIETITQSVSGTVFVRYDAQTETQSVSFEMAGDKNCNPVISSMQTDKNTYDV